MSYSEYGFIDMDFFVWLRSNVGYDIKSKPGQDVFELDSKNIGFNRLKPSEVEEVGPFIAEKPETTGYITMRPLEHSTLFREFVDLDGSPDSFIEFANQHGLLTQSYLLETTPEASAIEAKKIRMDSLRLWEYEHWALKRIVDLWNWLQNKDTEKLQQVVKWDKDNKGVRVEIGCREDLKSPFLGILVSSGDRDVYPRFVPGDVFLPAQFFLQDQVNRKLKQYPVYPVLLMDRNNELKQYFRPENQLAAMWFQFFQVVTGKRIIKQCTLCHEWVDVTNMKATWTRHAACANRDRVKRHRQNKKGVK